ncbi:MAG: TetR/AcrR family transcriptional regulator [Saccharofermentanales bacterium]|mgnify:CR=1 FL=1|jgi:AcrR family transcriptional regulator
MEKNVQDHSDIKEKIIDATVSLIESSDGLIENITMRAIAQKADVAVGLINYHFTSKKNLIEICVQRIISHVMSTFPGTGYTANGEIVDENRDGDMASFTSSVFTFLNDHPEISKISMLSDLSHPDIKSNSSVSYRAILKAIPDTESEDIRKVKAFMLLSTIQSAFLNREIGDELLGHNLNDNDKYKRFFRIVTEILNIP